MPRSPRLEYPGAVYHITARGIQQGPIFIDDCDRVSLMANLAQALQVGDAQAFAYCLMGNHYHFVIQTRRANLSTLMHDINSPYCMGFNQRHQRRGHVFEGRFKAVHVDQDAYLLEVCRYVDLNPVRAGLVHSPMGWAWSSYQAHVGAASPASWLATAELHGTLMGQVPQGTAQLAAAQGRYAEFVDAGREHRLWKASLRQRAYLGDDAFVERVRRLGR